MANTSFNVVGLDFDEIKDSLKEFLLSQETLKDYNFDGSVLSTILDVLAYNTHYQAFYANMVANEMFLDSAIMRPSVVSHAKTLGYVPSSRRAAKTVITVNLTPNYATSNTYLPKGSEFLGVDGDGAQYTFVTTETHYVNTQLTKFENVAAYEGVLRRVTYIYDPEVRQSSYLVIPNDKVDTSTIRVTVQKSTLDNSGSTDKWILADSFIDLKPTSKVFFLQERESGIYEVYFGDNFLGKKPDTGNVVIIEYLETNGESANGISRFSASFGNVAGLSASISSGGVYEESISRIKHLAPKHYSSQDRAVTESDYVSAVMKEFPNTSSIYVYGGETITPPQYGKVMIAIKPKSGSALTSDQKATLKAALKSKRSVLGIVPEIVDSDPIDVVIDSVITYDPSLLNIGTGTLKSLIVAYLFTYSSSALESFGSNLYLSKIVQGINGIHSAVASNQTKLRLRRSVDVPVLNGYNGYVFHFKNPISPLENSVSSNIFSHKNVRGKIVQDVFLSNEQNGTLNLYGYDASRNKYMVYPNIGSVNYEDGSVSVKSSFNIEQTSGLFTLTVDPENTDLYVSENKIFRISRGYSDSIKVRLVKVGEKA